MKCALILCLVTLAGCVQADIRHTSATGAVTEAHLRRLWSSTSLSVDPVTGAIAYSSQPQSDLASRALGVAEQALGQRPAFEPMAAREPPPLLPSRDVEE